MTKFETLEVCGFDSALYGMRNPLKSWDKSDSVDHWYGYENFEIGPNDYKLAKSLYQAGPEHRKWMRQVIVWANITLPRYVWSEFDTYKVGTTANSESTMHTLLKEDFDYSQFEWPRFDLIENETGKKLEEEFKVYINFLKFIRNKANYSLDKQEKEEYQRILKAMLPESFLQMRTVCLNYEVLANMYRQRKHHRLPQWSVDFVSWVKTLPYSEFITGEFPQ